ncbi:MAG: pirin family protein [Myxococcota bacterium]|nr:pirin family protein [Myxococcota bacterium]
MSKRPDHEPAGVEPAATTVELVIEGRPRGVGSITVARLLPFAKRRMIGPFIYLDHMGPVELAADVGFDVPPHPHIGLSTVTYFLAGENVHRDSLGTVQVNRPGDLNLMTAGRGVVHSERADPAWRARGGVMHGIQMWVALPTAHEDDAPSFEHHPQATLPAVTPADGVRGRVLMGRAYGATSPIRHPSEPLLIDLELEVGATVELPADAERGVLVIEGEICISDQVLGADHLAVLLAGAPAEISATARSRVLVVGGATLGDRLIDWNFVASTRDRIDRARAEWKAQAPRFPKVPGDDGEVVPYPERHHDARLT